MQDSRVLVIVDMQRQFETANCLATRDNVVELVEDARANQDVILVLEYVNYGSTRQDIMDAIGEYPERYIVHKDEDDGSKEIRRILKLTHVNPTEFIICGVNYGFCVADTAIGLKRLYSDTPVRVISYACNQPDYEREDDYNWQANTERLQDNGVMVEVE